MEQQSVAVLLTGKLRHLASTLLKQNLLLHNDVHVFAVVENDTPLSDCEANQWLRKEVGPHLKEVAFFSPQNFAEYSACQEMLLTKVKADPAKWGGPLRHHRSMAECFQLHLAHVSACRFEREHRYMFDFVVRVRTDAVFGRPVDFRWLQWSDAAVQLRLNLLGGDPQTLLQRFMATLLHADAADEADVDIGAFLPCYEDRIPESLTGASVNRYLRRGHYILTFFQSDLFIVRRILSYEIGLLCSARPMLPSARAFWIDVHSQFRRECNESGLSVFDYTHPHCALVVG